MTVNLQSRIKSMAEKVLEIGDIIVPVFGSSDQEEGLGPKVDAFFFIVARWNPLFARVGLNNLSNNTTMGPGPLKTDGIEGSNGGGTSGANRVFLVKKETPFTMYHAAIRTTQNSSNVKLGIKNPSAEKVTGFRHDSPFKDDLTDSIGWYPDDLAQSNGLPTDLTEQLYLPEVTENIVIRNETGSAFSSDSIEVFGRGYEIMKIDNGELIRRIIEGQFKERTFVKPFGSLKNELIGLPNQWGNASRLPPSKYAQLLLNSAIKKERTPQELKEIERETKKGPQEGKEKSEEEKEKERGRGFDIPLPLQEVPRNQK